jgi:hypothetical protein
LKNRVRKNLELFYRQRAERLHTLSLDDVLSRVSHPFWTTENGHAPEIVARLIEEYLTGFEKWWNVLIHDKDFCLEVIRLRARIDKPQFAYERELAKARTRLTLAFINRYCALDYAIDWEKLLRFNSGAS